MVALTDRQQSILDGIRSYMRQHQCPPTRRDIMRMFAISSPNGAQAHVKALIRKGHLVMIGKASRAMIVPTGDCPYCGAVRS